ncbi:hypothetical protein [Burkholderia seminalis]|uniref:hypothetical protein n=1 Tax=Burkholderia seminalis TaxID=488731 RepID=UPI0031D62C96
MKHGVTLRAAFKYGTVALLSFVVGRLSTILATWPHTPKWMDVDATGVVVNGVVAVGTCAAVIVALFIATRQNQQKMRDDLNRAKLTAVGVTFRLGVARAYIVRAIDDIKSEAKSNSKLSNESLFEIVRLLKGSDVFDWSEIHNLSSLPGNPAAFLACAKDRIHLLIGAIESVIDHPGTESPTVDNADTAVLALEDAERWIAKATEICEAQTIGFAPPDGSIVFELQRPSTAK